MKSCWFAAHALLFSFFEIVQHNLKSQYCQVFPFVNFFLHLKIIFSGIVHVGCIFACNIRTKIKKIFFLVIFLEETFSMYFSGHINNHHVQQIQHLEHLVTRNQYICAIKLRLDYAEIRAFACYIFQNSFSLQNPLISWRSLHT